MIKKHQHSRFLIPREPLIIKIHIKIIYIISNETRYKKGQLRYLYITLRATFYNILLVLFGSFEPLRLLQYYTNLFHSLVRFLLRLDHNTYLICLINI